MTIRAFTATATAVAALSLAACGGQNAQTETAAAEAVPAAEGAATDAAANAPVVGGAPMLPTANIVENASKSADHTTLVAAVTAAGLAETLSGPGPFTVFAPTNAAFGKLPAGTVETLTQPAQKQQLTGILTYHVVPGDVTAAQLQQQIQSGGGKAELTTVAGGKLTAAVENGSVVLTDAKGGKATVTQADVDQSNGVIHVIDTVLMPS